jgi:hypothetical protein
MTIDSRQTSISTRPIDMSDDDILNTIIKNKTER